MIANRFEEQVKMYPERIAIKTVDRELSYQLLNSYANVLANEIINKYTESFEDGKENTMALLFEHGTDMIVSTIGALKAGKIYVPFDPSYPIKRLLYMLENSEARLIVTNNKNLELALNLVNETKALVSIFNIDEVDYSRSIENIDRKICDNHIAYILYTSGSTGKPKGVIQTHKNILHFIKSYTNTLGITKEDKMTLFSAFSHDASIMDIYGALLNGATLYPLNIKEQISINEFASWLQKEGITIYHSVPTVYRYFVNTLTEKERFEKLRFIVLGGENVIEHDIAMFKKLFTSTRLINLYGQTESSYNSSQIFLTNSEFENITLGETVEETEILVVDENGEEVAPLRVGEIVILSDYVALGYWKDEEKTKEVFQYSPEADKLYWTGDLGRLLEDGSIKFMGRKGSQVKIRGYRVELGEVETQLLNYEAIKQAVVLSKKDANGDDYLTAYIVSNRPLTVAELREYLSMQLPEYMIPSNFVELEKMPLTPNRKVDTKALLRVEGSMLVGIEYEAPRNEVEEKLVAIWKDVLGTERVGINDNFFELGGNSFKAIILVGKIYKEIDVEVLISDIFKIPTIKGISKHIKNKEKKIYQSILKVEDRIHYPASRSQKRLFIFNQLHPYDISYNMTMILMIDGELDINRLENALENMRKRHAILRTSFKFENGEVLQIINENCKIPVNSLEIANSDLESMAKKLVEPFNLSKAPLLKVNYIKTEENKQMLIIDMHHIISDGISMKIFRNELIYLYQGKELKPLEIQYKDFSEWQNNYLSSEYIKNFENYWIKNMENFSITRLPQKYYINNEEAVGLNKILYFNKETTTGIDKLCKKNGITKFVYFAGVLNIILMNETSKTDITIGVPTSGRNHNQVQNLLGLFLNVLLIRTKIDPNKTFKEYFKMMNENIMEAFNNEDYPYEELYDMICERQNFREDSLFTIMLNYMPYQNNKEENEEIKAEGITIKPYQHKEVIPKYDMTLYVRENKEDIEINMVYKKVIYEDIIDRIAKSFEYISDRIIENEENTITKIDFAQITHHNNRLQEFDEYFEDDEFFMND